MPRLAVFLLWLAGAALAAPAWCSDYPTRTIRLVVTSAPGGANDVLARLLGERLSRTLGRGAVVENRPGANGMVAAETVARSAPDGHTLLVAPDALFVINPHLQRELTMDVLRDLVPVAALAHHDFVLLVNAAQPAATLAQFVEYARQAKPPLAYGSSGVGSQHHLLMEVFRRRAGVEMLHVPYKGGAAAAHALATGEVGALIGGAGAAPLVRAGKLRALAVTGERRSPLFPDAPALGEHFPGFRGEAWLGLFAPAGTPAAPLARLQREVEEGFSEPGALLRLADAGALAPLRLDASAFAALIQRDHARYGEIVRQIGFRAE